MATINLDGKKIEIGDNKAIKDACEKLEVPFGCRVGICGVCKITILEGMENLSELTNEEKDKNLDNNQRLACQVKIKQGVVKIKVE